MMVTNKPTLRGYLKQWPSLVILTGFLPSQWWVRLLHSGLAYIIGAALLAVAGLWIYNRVSGSNALNVDGRKVSYLVLVLALGAGLIVNVIFKDHFGRARPRDIEAFGGSSLFTPAFVISDQCARNCSFSSGEGAGGFFALALARVLCRRRAATIAAVVFGSLVSLARIAVGAHFFSDIVVSFFVMLIVTDALYFAMGFTKQEIGPDRRLR